MFKDKVNVGLDAETLSAILTGLPPEFADGVCAELRNILSKRRN